MKEELGYGNCNVRVSILLYLVVQLCFLSINFCEFIVSTSEIFHVFSCLVIKIIMALHQDTIGKYLLQRQ